MLWVDGGLFDVYSVIITKLKKLAMLFFQLLFNYGFGRVHFQTNPAQGV